MGASTGQHLGILEQLVERKREQPARSLMPRNEEVDHLITNILIIQALASHWIASLEHTIEQIVFRRGSRILLAMSNKFICKLMHIADVPLILPFGQYHQLVLDREPPSPGT